MNVSIEEKKQEAMRRMRKLNYYGQSRKAFYDKGKVMVNEPPLGGHFYVDDYEGLPEKIAEFEYPNSVQSDLTIH